MHIGRGQILRAVAALLFVIPLLVAGAPADATPYETFNDFAQRGVVTADGTSVGAFSISPSEFSFQDVLITANYGGLLQIASAYADPSTVTTTQTVDDPNGTAGLADLPFILSTWLPSPASTPHNGLAQLFTLTGSQSFSMTVTPDSGDLKLQVSAEDIDPVTQGLISTTLSGLITPGSNGSPDAISYSAAVQETITACAQPSGGFVTTTRAASGDGTPSPVAAVSQGVCLPEPGSLSLMLGPVLLLLAAIAT